eukprot:13629573-Heterocapsa_arctica.AAC.1
MAAQEPKARGDTGGSVDPERWRGHRSNSGSGSSRPEGRRRDAGQSSSSASGSKSLSPSAD